MDLWQALASVGTVCTIIFGYLAFRRNRKQDDENTGANTATVLTEIGYIKGGVDDIKRQQEKQADQHIEVVTRLTAVEESSKSAHHRIDGLENKIGGKINDLQ